MCLGCAWHVYIMFECVWDVRGMCILCLSVYGLQVCGIYVCVCVCSTCVNTVCNMYAHDI